MSTETERVVVDRFESDVAVLVADDGSVLETNRSSLPAGARSGSVLAVTRDGAGAVDWSSAQLDEEETAQRLAQAESVLEELRKRDPGGDIVL